MTDIRIAALEQRLEDERAIRDLKNPDGARDTLVPDGAVIDF